jgi:hypothetical protein
MRIERLDHVQPATPPGEEDAARAFCEGARGLAENKPPRLAKRGGLRFEQGDLKARSGADPDLDSVREAHRPSICVHDPFGKSLELMEFNAP